MFTEFSPYDDLAMDMSEMVVTWKRGNHVKTLHLTDSCGVVLNNFLNNKGWIKAKEIMISFEGEKIYNADADELIKQYTHQINKAFRYAEIPIKIDRQRQTMWIDGAWRLAYIEEESDDEEISRK